MMLRLPGTVSAMSSRCGSDRTWIAEAIVSGKSAVACSPRSITRPTKRPHGTSKFGDHHERGPVVRRDTLCMEADRSEVRLKTIRAKDHETGGGSQ